MKTELQGNSEYEVGLARLRSLCEQHPDEDSTKDINEATTRLQLIDVLLFECLAWPRSQCTAEERTEVGVMDYSLRIADRPLLVVEAKRASVSFSLPVVKQPKVIWTVDALLSRDKGIAAAAEQAASYALEKGIPVAAISNGHQLAAFMSTPAIGRGWREGRVAVFDSLSFMLENFRDLYDLLSPASIACLRIRDQIADRTAHSPARRRSDDIPNYKRHKNRNSFQADLQILGDLVFGGSLFEDRQLFQRYCYCSGGALPQFSNASRAYLEDRYSAQFSASAATPELTAAQSKAGSVFDVAQITTIRRPVLLLGDVGVGKSTFIEHLVLVDWKLYHERLIFIHINFADRPTGPDGMQQFVGSEIDAILRERYNIDVQEDAFLREVYKGELSRLRKSPIGRLRDSDPIAYLRREVDRIDELRGLFDDHWRCVFKHLVRNQEKMIVIAFDNVDQRDAKMQNAAFVQAQIAASKWDVYAMVALRPDTFVRAKLTEQIAGYHPRAFTISPPRFDRMIEARINTALRMLTGELPVPSSGGRVRMDVHKVADYLRVLSRSMKERSEIVELLEDISGGNMRLGLDILVAFLSCGHVDAEKILGLERQGKAYVIPIHEFTRGVMFGAHEFYCADDSYITNVFDTHTSDPSESFAILCLLRMLDDGATRSLPSGSVGYVSRDEVALKLIEVGFNGEQVDWCLRRATSARLVESDLKAGDYESVDLLRLTQPGSYYLKRLIPSFTYSDAVCLVTPISSESHYDRIKDERSLTGRLDRVSAFIDYLDSVIIRIPAVALLARWTETRSSILSDVGRIKERATSSEAFRRGD